MNHIYSGWYYFEDDLDHSGINLIVLRHDYKILITPLVSYFCF